MAGLLTVRARGALNKADIQTPCIALHRTGAKQQKNQTEWGGQSDLERCMFVQRN
jgi:hypothetical protein